MCGIAGILAFDDALTLDEPTVSRMTATLRHRGPDDAGTYVRPEERVALGHRRLSIIDLSSAGHQPMSNEDGTVWITYNGEVYNHAELRAELEARGHRFRSATDTEAIVHLYEEEGPACVERLHGMFAFAIWDAAAAAAARPRSARRQAAVLRAAPARPALRLGGQGDPRAPGGATRPRRGGVRRLPDLRLHAAAADHVPRHLEARARTVADCDLGWARRPPHLVGSDASGGVISRRRRHERGRDGRRGAPTRLRESIRKRMMSDVPFGVFLSGGLDSSTNVALMAELTDAPVRTYSTAPRGHARYDELPYARVVARHFGTDHHEVLVDEQAMREFVPELVFHQDEPLSDWTAIPQHFVSRLARDTGTIVVQVGEGADELFHGYKGYVDHRRVVVPFQRWVPRAIRAPVGAVAAHATARTGRAVRHGEALYDAGHSRIPYWGGALCFRGPLKERLLRRDHRDSLRTVERIWDEGEARRGDADLFQRMTYLELRQRLPELLLARMDRIAMASSVEGREPFLDHELVELAMALPPRMKYRDGKGKHVLREAMRDTLPATVLARPKQGFGSPMEEWLRGDFGRDAQAAVRGSVLAQRELIDYGVVDRLFAAHRAGRGDWSKHLWNLYCVSEWYDQWIA